MQQLLMAISRFLPQSAMGLFREKLGIGTSHDWLGSDLRMQAPKNQTAAKTAQESLGLPDVTDLRSLCLNMTYASNLPMLLHWEDRSSMAHSIEARVPFLDHPLVEFSLALGNEHKIVGGDTKHVLRQAMSGILPETVRNRRDKLGFATPEETWFRGPLRKLIEEGVEQALRLYPELFDAENMRRLTNDMLDGRKKFDFLLWRVVNIGIWGRKFSVGL
jgi:asparagine synthase (glutamine-hydrolysing)